MFPVPQRFLDALSAPHKVKTKVTVTTPLGVVLTFSPIAGSVNMDTGTIRRRRASLRVEVTSAQASTITTPGAVFRITHGLDFGGGDEILVPVFTGELADPDEEFGQGVMTLSLVDLSAWLARVPFVTPYVPLVGTLRSQAIANIVTAARPATAIANTATDAGIVGKQMWTGSRLSAIEQLATDGNMVAYFSSDGTFIIRDAPTASDAVAYTIRAGTRGTLVDGSRKRSLSGIINNVVVRPAASSGVQRWKQVEWAITDLANPLHPNYVGLATHTIDNFTGTSSAEALVLAKNTLARLSGIPERLTLAAISNPALEGDDVVSVVTSPVGNQAALDFRVWVDAYDLDLKSGLMGVDTRSQGVSNG